MPLSPSNSAPDPRAISFAETKLRGCYAGRFPVFEDHRGIFMKTLQYSAFKALGLETDYREVFYTNSTRGVLRGMHFQVPPSDHVKLVYCVSGAVCDIALDLRIGSPTYGQHEVYELNADEKNAVYLPSGIAHGFQVRSENAGVFYHVSSEHDPARDQGIRWDSFGAPWPLENPVISARDATHVPFSEFKSPFVYRGIDATSPERKP